jgi:preprotein translocase subunit SecY
MLVFFETVLKIFRVSDLRRRILFTFGLLTIYRIGSLFSVPGTDRGEWGTFFSHNAGGMIGLIDLFTGGNTKQLTGFALGIVPYAVALALTAAKGRQSEHDTQREFVYKAKPALFMGLFRKYNLTFFITVIMSIIIAWTAMENGMLPGYSRLRFALTAIFSLGAGTALAVWIVNLINSRGIGNGMWMVVFAGIVSGLPEGVLSLYKSVFIARSRNLLELCVTVAAVLLIIAATVLIEKSERRIPLQYSNEAGDRSAARAHSSFFPLRVDAGGVATLVRAAIGLSIVQAAWQIWRAKKGLQSNTLFSNFGPGEPMYYLLFIVVIIAIGVALSLVSFDALANQLQSQQVFIPGIRPGRRTVEYCQNILRRCTAIGVIQLSLIWFAASSLSMGIKLDHISITNIGNHSMRFPRFILDGMDFNSPFFGISIVFAVVVSMELVDEINAGLMMRHFEGFTPGSGRIKGRRT